MSGFAWTLIDTETSGLHPPIYVVELAAQRMSDWEPNGPPFRVFINHEVDIPDGAQRIHGYSRDFLARKGIDARWAHQSFDQYAGKTPIGSYNLTYDHDKVLVPEWRRLRHVGRQSRGFCILKLARSLIQPSGPANFKLQTLREHFGLPDRGAHSASGDVLTVLDLLRHLRPDACRKNLESLQNVDEFVSARGYPDRLMFGKYKGRKFTDAASDIKFFGWLEWLCRQPEPESAAIGAWYLAELAKTERADRSESTSVDFGYGSRPQCGAPDIGSSQTRKPERKGDERQVRASRMREEEAERQAKAAALARAREEALQTKVSAMAAEARRRREEATAQRAASEAMLLKALRAAAEADARRRADQAMLSLSPEAEEVIFTKMNVDQKYAYLRRKYAAHKFEMAQRWAS